MIKQKPTERNFLRLFAVEEMAEQYGKRGKEVLDAKIKGNSKEYISNAELHQNIVDDYGYYTLSFYTGDFKTAKQASKNPNGSLGWSSCFIRYGIRLFLLYLYENPLPSKAAAILADAVGFSDDAEARYAIGFECDLIEESRQNKTSIFWNYWKRWKQYFPMEQEERNGYFQWAEKIVRSRADAIVGGQYRRHYKEVAVLLAVVAEIKEQMGVQNAKQGMFTEYKKKFPRHSAFQAEMKSFFGM